MPQFFLCRRKSSKIRICSLFVFHFTVIVFLLITTINKHSLSLLQLNSFPISSEVSDDYLIKFLLWKPNVKRASDRFKILQKWRKDNPWAHTNLKLSQDEKLKKFVSSNTIIVPGSIVTKDGCTVLIGRLRFNDMADGRTPEDVCRMIFYSIDRAMELQSTQENGLVIFHDLKDVSKNNVHPGIAKLLFRAIIGHFPLRIKGIYLLNAPFFFKGLFTMVSSLLFPKKMKERVHYVDSLEEIYDVIDKDLLLVEHGGMLDFDVDAWIEEQIQREQNDDWKSILLM